MNPNPVFKVRIFFDAEYLQNDCRYGHIKSSFIESNSQRLNKIKCHGEPDYVSSIEVISSKQ